MVQITERFADGPKQSSSLYITRKTLDAPMIQQIHSEAKCKPSFRSDNLFKYSRTLLLEDCGWERDGGGVLPLEKSRRSYRET